jgi:putative hemolysin
MALAGLILLVILNGLLALSEIALVSARKNRLRQEAESGDRRAAAALALAENPTRFLSTVQVGITSVSILSGVFGEAALADDVKGVLDRVEALKPYSRIASSALTVVGITYLSLVIGELLPKRVALASPERIAKLVAPAMTLLSRAAAPIVWILTRSTDIAVRPFGGSLGENEAVTEDDMRGIIRQAAEEGVIHSREHQLVERVLRLGDQRVLNLMVPRTEIEWLEADASVDRIRVAVATSVHSHFPICRESLDQIVGVVHVKDLVRHLLVSETVDLSAIARKPLYVPEAMPAVQLPDRFAQFGTRFAFVVDEYGGVEGIITLNDVLEALIGLAATPENVEDTMAVQRADGSWLIDGGMDADDFRELTTLPELPEGHGSDYTTVGGMITHELGRIPHPGESMSWRGWRLEIVDLDGPRIDKIIASRLPSDEADGRPPDGVA